MVEGCHRKRVENHGNQCHSRSDGTVGIFSPMLVIQDYYSLGNKYRRVALVEKKERLKLSEDEPGHYVIFSPLLLLPFSTNP